MNTTKPEIKEDVPQIAASLIDFVVDDVEIKKGCVDFNLVYKFDSDIHVAFTCETVDKQGEHYYLPKGSIDPQDELLHKYDYPETVGFATVGDFYSAHVEHGQLIMLTEQQEQKLNEWMYNEVSAKFK